MLENIVKFAGPKDDIKELEKWCPLTLMYFPGTFYIFVSDPDMIQDSQKEKHLIDKNSFLKKDVFDKRIGDNV